MDDVTIYAAAKFLSTPSARRATEAARDTARCCVFLSTPSARRATGAHLVLDDGAVISIHALCEEGDNFQEVPGPFRVYFYPRPLRGGRPTDTAFIEVDYLFLSTPSARRATDRLVTLPLGQTISIHALCEEGDLPGIAVGGELTGFLSTPSARRATVVQPTS